ncbi:DUF3592 domain-containing protein [Streptomyces sp. NPDC037389]|uniref:DUF3592 domain-containing protein n=1 Tax=Streptomyces sp. NPDC037389 TaxID=3155369 RepID=UPI0033F976F2
MLFVFGSFIYPFGLRPLLVDRRLRSNGVTVEGRCLRAFWSEDRVSEHFKFATLSGRVAFYRSPLGGSRLAGDGEVLDIVYDPRNPRRARTRRELSRKSPAWRNLWGGVVLVILMQIFFLKLFI